MRTTKIFFDAGQFKINNKTLSSSHDAAILPNRNNKLNIK